VSEEEAHEFYTKQGLSFKKGHHKGGKWIGTPNSIKATQQLGKHSSHSYRITMRVDHGTIKWLRQYEKKKDVEPDRFAIPERQLDTFNNSIFEFVVERIY
jgi:hypothetical protein